MKTWHKRIVMTRENAQAILNSCRREAYDKGFGKKQGFPEISVTGKLLNMRTVPGK